MDDGYGDIQLSAIEKQGQVADKQGEFVWSFASKMEFRAQKSL